MARAALSGVLLAGVAAPLPQVARQQAQDQAARQAAALAQMDARGGACAAAPPHAASAQATTPWPDYYNWGAGDPAWAEYAQAQYSNYVASYYGYGQPAPEPAPPGAAAAKTEGAPRGGAASRRRGSVLTLAG